MQKETSAEYIKELKSQNLQGLQLSEAIKVCK